MARLRRRLTAVFQDAPAFSVTFGENIMLGRPAGRTAAGLPASSTRRSWRKPSALPAGVDTLLTRESEGGTDLSGGQWQRLAVARALVDEEAGVVVLHEASSNLDPVAEAPSCTR